MRTNPAQLQLELDAFLSTPAPPMTKTPEQLNAEIAAYLAKPELEPVVPNPYEAKQAARRTRLQRASERARGESETAHRSAARTWGAIPMGQPILVGHHSERRHRRDLAKADRAMRRSIEADKRSKQLAARAAAVGTAGVSSDDPDAVKKLRGQLVKLEQDQERMKRANDAIRRHAKAGQLAQLTALTTLGFSEQRALKLLQADFAGRQGFPGWALTNNNTNIRRIKKRIADLTARGVAQERESIEGEVDGLAFKLLENREANRVQIVFDGKPSSDVRQRLRSAGFRWAPSQNAWQRQLSNGAWFHAKRALLIPDVVRAQAT